MPKAVNILRLLLWLLLAATSAVTIVFSGTVLYLGPKLPAVENILAIQLQTPLRIYSSDHKLIAEFGEKKRAPIAYSDVPQPFVDAILAAEDSRFFKHSGVDMKGLTRAVLELVTSGSIQTGGSTITMQVAKNYFLTLERTFLRKFNEILLALDMERKLSKEQILELYLNKIYLGHRSYGVEAAALVYYGKPLADLSLAQIAMIAGLPKAPSAFNPITNPERALIRRNWILNRMFLLGNIDKEQLDSSLAEPVTAELHGIQVEVEAPYFAEMVRRKVVEMYGLKSYTAGISVITTLKSSNQQAANTAVRKGLIEYDRRHGYRGPEAQLSLPTLLDDPDLVDLEASVELLEPYRVIGPLQPALVTQLEPEKVAILLSDRGTGSIEFASMSWARPYISNLSMGPEPEAPSDLLQAGDVIYVTWENDQWQLAQKPLAQSALVSLDTHDGGILALVGGFDYQISKFNRVTQGARQAGSGFKPFIYSAALAKGMTPATIINDAPVVFADQGLENTWRPENSGGRFFGPTRMRKALYMSRNLVSIRLLRQIGVSSAIRYAGELGFDTDRLPHNLSLALGSAEFTPMEIATAYAVLANGGYRVEPWFIDRIEDNTGETVYRTNPARVCKEDCQIARAEAQAIDDLLADNIQSYRSPMPPPVDAKQVQDPRINFLITDMLQDVIQRGTGTRAKVLQRNDLAGKTGTTNDQKDAWFSGFNPDVVASVWVGFDQPTNLGNKEFGGTAALPIWIDYMKDALAGIEEKAVIPPDQIVTVRIDPATGQRVDATRSGSIFEYFRTENVPSYELVSSPASSSEAADDEALPLDIF